MEKNIYKIKRYLSLDGFSVASVYIQIALLVLLSLVIVSIFGVYYGSFQTSYLAFMDPTSIPDSNMLVVFIELLVGLIIASFVISILSSSLENFIEQIKKGSLAFTKSDHIIFFNVNDKILQILSELNDKFTDLNKIQEIVILLQTPDQVEEFLEYINMKDYPYLSIFVKYGNHIEQETYNKFNLKEAKSIILLKNGDDFEADNELLKVYTSLLLSKIDFNISNLVIEGNSTYEIDNIYSKLKEFENFYNIAYIDTNRFLSKLLTRTLVDVAYYKIYEEIFSFDGYELYIKKASSLDIDKKSYKDISLELEDALLLGFKRDNQILLNKYDAIINTNDELIIVAKNENEIVLKPKDIKVDSITIEQPSEIVYKKICIIGDSLHTEDLFEFLNYKAKEDFVERKFDSFKEYLDRDFVLGLKQEKFDSIIINLSEEETIRYILYIVTLFGKDDPFIKQIISIVSNPENAMIIEKITGNKNIILSQRISAKFIAQLCFETELIDIIQELVSAKGSEFNIIENSFKNLTIDQLKLQLLNNKMSLVGLQDDNQVYINGKNLKDATHIIVLAEGEF